MSRSITEAMISILLEHIRKGLTLHMDNDNHIFLHDTPMHNLHGHRHHDYYYIMTPPFQGCTAISNVRRGTPPRQNAAAKSLLEVTAYGSVVLTPLPVDMICPKLQL